ncbi:hypothetical protein [Geoglobus acetivorans]|uniref:Uncharacterized protein n=1 Tax=Geoglobus acetivorans TaxID=565033 RepID=A0ABZ3H1A3_GEOAI|nr:hypothetical protein [Geoglobus acetivorans]
MNRYENPCDGCEIIVKVRVRRTESKIVIDIKNRKVNVLECNLLRNRCFDCVPFCEAIVAAKDFAFRRREPKAEVIVLNKN